MPRGPNRLRFPTGNPELCSVACLLKFRLLVRAAQPFRAPLAAAMASAAYQGAAADAGAAPPGAPMRITQQGQVMPWLLRVRPYLRGSVCQYSDGLLGLPMDAVLAPGDHGMTIVHQMIDALRQEANTRAWNPHERAPHAVPWDAVLRLPGTSQFANVAVPRGPAQGKTPLCLLADQRMPGSIYGAASKAICTWLLERRADLDLPQSPGKSPLMLAAGSGHADMVEFLLGARASVEWPAGPGLDAVLACAIKTKGDGINMVRVLRCLEDRGYDVDWDSVPNTATYRGWPQSAARSSADAVHSAAAQPTVAAPARAPPPPSPTLQEQREYESRKKLERQAWEEQMSAFLDTSLDEPWQQQRPADVERRRMQTLIKAELEQQRLQRVAAGGAGAYPPPPPPPKAPAAYDADPPPPPPRRSPVVPQAVAGPAVAAPPAAAPPPGQQQQQAAVGIGLVADPPPPPPPAAPVVAPAAADPAVAAPAAAAPPPGQPAAPEVAPPGVADSTIAAAPEIGPPGVAGPAVAAAPTRAPHGVQPGPSWNSWWWNGVGGAEAWSSEAWRGAASWDGTWSSAADPGPALADEGPWAWRWSVSDRAWKYSPQVLRSPHGRWAWDDAWEHAVYFELPHW